MKIGVLSESFRLPMDAAIERAAELGLDGIQGYASSGELSPAEITDVRIEKINQRMKDSGLVFSALCGDLGGHGFQVKQENEEKISKSCAIVDLANTCNAPVVTTHIGVIPEDPNCETYQVMYDACSRLADYAEKRGVTFAIETGPETPERLKDFLDKISSSGLGVNYDPANLVMILNEDPVKGVYTLADYIVHTHAKDGIHIKDCDPVKVYDAFAKGGIAGFDFGTYFNETPIGEGSVDWRQYLSALQAIGFDGFLTIEREVGDAPEKDIAQAVSFLRELVNAR